MEIKILKETILRNPMVYGVFVSNDFTSTLIQADFFSGISSRKIFEKIRELSEKVKSPEIEVYYSGRPILEGWLDFYLRKMWYLFFITIFVLGILLYFSFHSLRGVIFPILSSIMATIWGLSSIPVFGFSLTPSTILVPFFIFTIGVSHSVQFIKRYYDEIKFSQTSKEVSKKTLEMLLIPAAVSLVTDGIGFLSLIFVPFKLIKTMAISTGIGVLSIFLTTVFFIPSSLSYMKLPAKKEIEIEERHNFLDKFLTIVTNWITFRKKRIFITFSLLGIIGIIGLTKITIGDNQPGSPTLYPNSHYNLSEKIINKEFGGTEPYYILVEGKKQESIISVEVLKEIESLQNYILKNVDSAGRGISIVDYIKGFNMVFNDGKREFYRIPDMDATVGEYIFLYSVSGFPGDFDPVCSPDFNNANIKIDLKDHKTSTIKQVLKTTEEWINKNHHTERVDFLFPGGTIGILAAVNDVIKTNIFQNLILVWFFIFLFTSIFLGSFFLGFLLIIPLLFSIIFTFGIMGFLGVPLTIETLPLASLGIGLGIDYGIYIVGRMKDEQKDKNFIERSILTSGKAVFFTAFSVSIGVLVWIFSPVKMEAKLGICLASLLLLNMLSAIILLPGLFIKKNIFLFQKQGGGK